MQPIDFFFRAARLHADNVAIDGPDGQLSYAELAAQINSLAAGLQQLDPTPGSRVGIAAGNTVAHIVTLLSVLAAGKVWIPLNPRNSPMELDRIVDFTKPTIVFAEAKYGDAINLQNVSNRVGLDKGFSGSNDEFSELTGRFSGKTPERIPKSADDLQAIKFTGGSTGLPKGVMQPYRAWKATVINLIHAYQLDETTCNLLAGPVTHGASTYLLPVLAAGGRHVLMSEISAKTVLDALLKKGITTVFMPPTLIGMVIGASESRDLCFPALRHLIYGGSPMPVDQIRKAQEFFGPVIGVTYGQTEAPQIVSFMTGEQMMRADCVGSIGQASLLSDFAIMGSDGTLLDQGETGEIVVRGDMVMSGYLDQPEKTAETMRAGWLCTGDLGYIDNRGYLYLRGRRREVIISGGFNVYPIDVENALSTHPMIQECAVFGIPDEKWGEAVSAAVVLKPNESTSASEVMAYAKVHVGSVKSPKHVVFLNKLPRTAVGKVDKEALKLTINFDG